MSYVLNVSVLNSAQRDKVFFAAQNCGSSVTATAQFTIGGQDLFSLTLQTEQQASDLRNVFVSAQLAASEVVSNKAQQYTLFVMGQALSSADLTGLLPKLNAAGAVLFQSNEQQECLSLSFIAKDLPLESLKAELKAIIDPQKLDLVILKQDIYQANRRLVVFDMDSTLIQIEVIDELAKKAGIGDRVSAITAAAMRGEIDFVESFTQRLALLEGLSESVLDEIIESIPLMPGMERLLLNLNALGFKTAILSGGFSYFADYLKRTYGFDYAFSNPLEIDAGRVTGRVAGPIVDGERKVLLLRELAEKEGFDLRQTVAVGDGANDLPMLAKAGMGVAFHAKPIVREQAPNVITFMDLTALLYLLNVHKSEWV